MAGMFDDLIPQQAAPSAPNQGGAVPQGQGLSFDDLIPQPQSSVADFAKSLATGVPKGIVGIGQMADQGGRWMAGKAFDATNYLEGYSPQERSSMLANGNAYIDANPNFAHTLLNSAQSGLDALHTPTTTAGQYGNAIGQALPMALGGEGAIPAKLLSAGLAGAGSEAAGQATQGTGAEPYARVLGAVMGGLSPSVMSKAITPFGVPAARSALSQSLDDNGVNLTAGQKTGNSMLRYAESELGGGNYANAMENQGEQFTSAALAHAGVNGTRATPEVIDGAFKNIGNTFDGLSSRNPLPPDPQIGGDVNQAVTNYNDLVPSASRSPIVDKLGSDIAAASQNGLTGEQYQAFTSRLGKLSRATTDPQLGGVLKDFKNSLDDGMERNLQATNSPDLGAWQDARNQYRNLLVIQKAANAAGENAAQGIISPAALKNATIQVQGASNYARGGSDLADLARAGEGTMKGMPQSGTAPRSALRNILSAAPMVVGAGAGAGHGFEGSMLGAALGAALPSVTGKAIMSGPVQSYLANNLIPSSMKAGIDPRMYASLLSGGDNAMQLGNNGR